jgi:hypothetical protein
MKKCNVVSSVLSMSPVHFASTGDGSTQAWRGLQPTVPSIWVILIHDNNAYFMDTRHVYVNLSFGVLQVICKRGDKRGQDGLRRCVGYLPNPRRPGSEAGP